VIVEAFPEALSVGEIFLLLAGEEALGVFGSFPQIHACVDGVLRGASARYPHS